MVTPAFYKYYDVIHAPTGAKRKVCVYSFRGEVWKVSVMVRRPNQNLVKLVHSRWQLTEGRSFESVEKALLFLAMEDWIVQKPWWQQLWRRK